MNIDRIIEKYTELFMKATFSKDKNSVKELVEWFNNIVSNQNIIDGVLIEANTMRSFRYDINQLLEETHYSYSLLEV